MISATAQAKINLTLEVLKRREDGYHDIRSVVQTIDLVDTLSFRTGPRLEFHCTVPEWSAEKSLVSKAAGLLKDKGSSRHGASIEIEKRIPLVSGLGGDSSDAAAVLRGLNLLWNLELSLRDLINIGAQLGSDVPLFLLGGTLLMEGRGEKIRPLPPMPHRSVILLIPKIPRTENKTRQMYTRLTQNDYSLGQATDNFVQALEKGQPPEENDVYNVFDDVGMRFFSRLKDARLKFLEAGANSVHLAGSGPTLFSLIKDNVEANQVHKKLIEMGQETYLADF
jgi:4-diphosphocytidyl-2-C-methyl-D-erythritol kinase